VASFRLDDVLGEIDLDAAKGLGMNPPSGPNAKQKADYDKTSKMSGAAFDKMFAKASKMKDAAGEYASGQIDTLQKHLDTAKSLNLVSSPAPVPYALSCQLSFISALQ
jgi:hypothetical protein